MEHSRPSEKFLQRASDLFIGHRIRMREKHRTVRLSRVAGGNPVEIPFAIGSEAEPFSPTLRPQIDRKFLALQIKRQKSFDPFRWILRFCEIIRIRVRPANLKSLRQNRLVILIKRNKAPRKKRADSLLDFLCMRMHQSVSKRIARRLVLLRSHPAAKLMKQSPRAENGDKNSEGHDEGAKSLGEQSLHQAIILESSTKKRTSHEWKVVRTQ